MTNNFSVKNWLVNSGIKNERQEIIMDLHFNATKKIKDVYKMKIIDGDCIIRTKNIIVTGEK